MFLYPALTIGFLFVAVPLLVHLINMLRHRKQQWAAMDFLLASYRKQRRWILLRQLLLLLARLALAALLIAMLCGWHGGKQLLDVLGGQTTHHVFILDDSYSMGDVSGGATSYQKSLQALQGLTRRLAADDGTHQLTVMRASRAALAVRGGSAAGDAAADLSAETVMSEARLIGRLMATKASSLRTDLVPALDLARGLVTSTTADSTIIYVASDFRHTDWASTERIGESLEQLEVADTQFRMIDCASRPATNLAIESVVPSPDVWVAGVPVTIDVRVRNFGTAAVTNLPLSCQVIQYSAALQLADPTLRFSGAAESLPTMIIESIAAGEVLTKSFQVYIADPGTHVVEVSLPEDALEIDNRRACTLPLTGAEKVLVIDGDTDTRGAYHIASVLNPGSQVQIGAIPDVQPPAFLRSVTFETLATYRAVYLVDIPSIGENAAAALAQYVSNGGGLALFVGSNAEKQSYNKTLLSSGRRLLPGPLDSVVPLMPSADNVTGDVVSGDESALLAPIASGGDAVLSLIGVSNSWAIQSPDANDVGNVLPDVAGAVSDLDRADDESRVYRPLNRRDGLPFVTQHDFGRGRVVTVLAGLDGQWTNWPRDPTFVVFMLQVNANLWSGVAPATSRQVDESIRRSLPASEYVPTATLLPAVNEPPRTPLEYQAESGGDDAIDQVAVDPGERALAGDSVIEELLTPGITEWQLVRLDGPAELVPVAAVIQPGEGDLTRVSSVEIIRGLDPLDVEFVSSGQWSDANQSSGSSTVTLVLLGLLVLMLAAEQALAYWASYHTPGTKRVAGMTSAVSAGGRR